jgi:hypothetical protein
LLSAVVAYGFHVLFYIDILSALILPILVSLACGWLFAAIGFVDFARTLMTRAQRAVPLQQYIPYLPITLLALGFVRFTFTQNQPFILSLTTDSRGIHAIEQALATPPQTTLLIGWGSNHSAVGYAQETLGLLPDVTLVDHNADIASIIQNGTIITPEYSFYTFPLSWWESRVGQRVYLDTAAPYLIRVRTAPTIAETTGEGVIVMEQHITCDENHFYLNVTWQAQSQPERDLSVFVHLLDSDGNIIAQGDQSAPVYGHYPLTLWQTGEVVRDIYPLTRLENAAQIRFGMYHQESDGSFINDTEYDVAVSCDVG